MVPMPEENVASRFYRKFCFSMSKYANADAYYCITPADNITHLEAHSVTLFPILKVEISNFLKKTVTFFIQVLLKVDPTPKKV